MKPRPAPLGYSQFEGKRCVLCGMPSEFRRDGYGYPVCRAHLFVGDLTVWRIWNNKDPLFAEIFWNHSIYTLSKIARGMASTLQFHTFGKDPAGRITLCGSFVKPESATELKAIMMKREPTHIFINKKIDGYDAARAWASKSSS